jgi:hypothetical protein
MENTRGRSIAIYNSPPSSAEDRVDIPSIRKVPVDESPELFRSVLEQPLPVWNSMEDAIVHYAPQWTPSQRSKLISSFVQFLELKVILRDYAANPLLAPTTLIGRTWYAIALKKKLYANITKWIQDFHAVPHHQIYRPSLAVHQDEKILNQRLERTQQLFVCYYQQGMPETLAEIDMAWRNRNAFENTVVPENDSDGGSDFEDDDDDTILSNVSRNSIRWNNDDDSTIMSDVSRYSIPWMNAFASWLTCWVDPFPETPQDPCFTETEEDPWYQLPFKVKKSNDSASTGKTTCDDEEEEESMWVVFDDEKREEDDAVTFLTMDQDNPPSSSAPSPSMDNEHMEQLEQLEQPAEKKSLAQERLQPPTTQEAAPTVKRQEEPKGWELFKTKFRIAVMVLQELE